MLQNHVYRRCHAVLVIVQVAIDTQCILVICISKQLIICKMNIIITCTCLTTQVQSIKSDVKPVFMLTPFLCFLDILTIALGIATVFLILVAILLLYKLSSSQKHKRHKRSSAINKTPTILPHDIPGFSLPLTRRVPVQEPIRSPKTSPNDDQIFDYDLDVTTHGLRTNNNLPVSTVLHSSQSSTDIAQEMSKMEPLSPLKKKSIKHNLSGSISLQDLNIYSPKKTRIGRYIILSLFSCMKLRGRFRTIIMLYV